MKTDKGRNGKPAAVKTSIDEYVATMKRYRMEEFSQVLDSEYRHRHVVLKFSKAEYEKLQLSAGSHERSIEDYAKECVITMTDTDIEDLAIGLVRGRYKVVEGEEQ